MLSLLKIIFLASQASAYLGLLTDGQILEPGVQGIGAESQFVFNKNDGINFAGHYETGLSDSLEFLADAGLGATDFFLGGNLKFVPYPDYEDQPAIGFVFGGTYANEEDDGYVTIQFKTFISKQYRFDYGDISPYAALSYGVTMTNEDDAEDPFHFIIGAKYKHFEWKDIFLYGELGTSLDEAFNYISFKLVFLFDSKSTHPLDNVEYY